jgi:hypothetical protein
MQWSGQGVTMCKGSASLALKIAFTVALSLAGSALAAGQTADQAWLKYTQLKNPPNVPMNVRSLGRGTVEQSAVVELRRGLLSLSGKPGFDGGPNFILLGTVEEMRSRNGQSSVPTLEPDEFLIASGKPDLVRELDIIGGERTRVALWGVCPAAQPGAGSGHKQIERARTSGDGDSLGR